MQTGNATAQPDPFDPLKIYPAHFALFPLVYSAGPDGLYGIEGGSVNYAAVTPRNDPWFSVTTAPIIGGPAVDGGKSNTHLDNLTNHFNVAD